MFNFGTTENMGYNAFFKKETSQVFWLTSVNLGHLSVWVWGQPRIHSEFQASLYCIVRLAAKKSLKCKLLN